MKTLNVIFCGLISLFLLACGNDLDVKYTLCKDKVSSRSKLSPNVDEHYLTYRVDGKTLKVELYNYMGSCGTEEIKVEPTRGESNQLIVKITEIGFSANCSCPIDISFSLADLKKGETYECVIQYKEPSHTTHRTLIAFTFEMKEGANGKILLYE
jgi:hypothetical protein